MQSDKFWFAHGTSTLVLDIRPTYPGRLAPSPPPDGYVAEEAWRSRYLSFYGAPAAADDAASAGGDVAGADGAPPAPGAASAGASSAATDASAAAPVTWKNVWTLHGPDLDKKNALDVQSSGRGPITEVIAAFGLVDSYVNLIIARVRADRFRACAPVRAIGGGLLRCCWVYAATDERVLMSYVRCIPALLPLQCPRVLRFLQDRMPAALAITESMRTGSLADREVARMYRDEMAAAAFNLSLASDATMAAAAARLEKAIEHVPQSSPPAFPPYSTYLVPPGVSIQELWQHHVDRVIPHVQPTASRPSSPAAASGDGDAAAAAGDAAAASGDAAVASGDDDGGIFSGTEGDGPMGVLAAAAAATAITAPAGSKRLRDDVAATFDYSIIGLAGDASEPSYSMIRVGDDEGALSGFRSGVFVWQEGCEGRASAIGAVLWSFISWATWRPTTGGGHAKLGSACHSLLKRDWLKYFDSISFYEGRSSGPSVKDLLVAIGMAPGLGVVCFAGKEFCFSSLPPPSMEHGVNDLLSLYFADHAGQGNLIGSESVSFVAIAQPGLTVAHDVDAFVDIGSYRLDLVAVICAPVDGAGAGAGAGSSSSSSSSAGPSTPFFTAIRYRERNGAGWLCHSSASGTLRETVSLSSVAPDTISLSTLFEGSCSGGGVQALFYSVRGALPGAPLPSSAGGNKRSRRATVAGAAAASAREDD